MSALQAERHALVVAMLATVRGRCAVTSAVPALNTKAGYARCPAMAVQQPQGPPCRRLFRYQKPSKPPAVAAVPQQVELTGTSCPTAQQEGTIRLAALKWNGTQCPPTVTSVGRRHCQIRQWPQCRQTGHRPWRARTASVQWLSRSTAVATERLATHSPTGWRPKRRSTAPMPPIQPDLDASPGPYTAS